MFQEFKEPFRGSNKILFRARLENQMRFPSLQERFFLSESVATDIIVLLLFRKPMRFPVLSIEPLKDRLRTFEIIISMIF